MPRLTVSVPQELHDRLEKWRDRMNISRVCQEALEREVRRLEELPDDAKALTGLVERLSREKADGERQWFSQGVSDGMTWARGAGYADLNNRIPEATKGFPNTYQGVRKVDPGFVEVARSFGSSEWRMWRDVLLPWAVPYIAAGVRLAIGRALVGMIIAEFYTSISGLGYMIVQYANTFRTDRLFVPIVVLMVMGVGLTSLLRSLERRVAPWLHAASGE